MNIVGPAQRGSDQVIDFIRIHAAGMNAVLVEDSALQGDGNGFVVGVGFAAELAAAEQHSGAGGQIRIGLDHGDQRFRMARGPNSAREIKTGCENKNSGRKGESCSPGVQPAQPGRARAVSGLELGHTRFEQCARAVLGWNRAVETFAMNAYEIGDSGFELLAARPAAPACGQMGLGEDVVFLRKLALDGGDELAVGEMRFMRRHRFTSRVARAMRPRASSSRAATEPSEISSTSAISR